jgi:hypothetical protein
MKIKSLLAGLLLSGAVANASITLSGTSIFSADLNGLSTGVYVASTSSVFNVSLFDFSESLDYEISFTEGSVFNGYTVLGSASINAAGGSSALVSGVTYNLGGNVATGNAIGVLAFANSTTETIAGDTFSIFTGGWVVPADGANLGLTGSPSPSFAGATGAGSVIPVPEPSAYALLGGLFALTCVMLRRRA